MGRGRRALALAGCSALLGAGAVLAEVRDDDSGFWEIEEPDDPAAAEGRAPDPPDEESRPVPWDGPSCDPPPPVPAAAMAPAPPEPDGPPAEEAWDDEEWDDDAEWESVEWESSSWESDWTDDCHGLVSCSFTLVGEVVALPFRVLGGVFRFVF